MKTLGITNLPSLEFMLDESVRFYENDGGSTTVDIIRSILTNKNLDYTFEDIYEFLLSAHKKYCCDYNLKNCDIFNIMA